MRQTPNQQEKEVRTEDKKIKSIPFPLNLDIYQIHLVS